MSSFSANLGSNGYMQFPNGAFLQYGASTIPTNGSVVITLPKAAPNAILLAFALLDGTQGATPDSVWVTDKTKTTIKLNHYGDNGGVSGIWFVICR
ncbi:gp53-like domain-containing protein [Enterobacter hormaechei]|uniref:gp53-like domain-containing protein n=1 Tax=Enterobacter hormaechei TaxID=158836 RepID=UPI00403AC00B